MVRKRFKLSGTLDHSGEWLIRLVHMRRCAADCAEIDWESFWGAYSFGMSEQSGPALGDQKNQ
jgi:hypothetical protein